MLVPTNGFSHLGHHGGEDYLGNERSLPSPKKYKQDLAEKLMMWYQQWVFLTLLTFWPGDQPFKGICLVFWMIDIHESFSVSEGRFESVSKVSPTIFRQKIRSYGWFKTWITKLWRQRELAPARSTWLLIVFVFQWFGGALHKNPKLIRWKLRTTCQTTIKITAFCWFSKFGIFSL